jgi:hypothetical protein
LTIIAPPFPAAAINNAAVPDMLLRQHRRLKAKYADLQWNQNERGVH